MASLSRRRLLGAGAALTAGAAGWLAGGRWLTPGEPGTLLRSQVPPPEPYRVALPIPPVLRPVRTDATTDHYEITQRVATLSIVPGLTTQAWTYDGTFPGPTLVARSGRRVVVRHRNELPEPSVVHLHGGHTPADSDGYPMDVVLPTGIGRHHDHHAYRDVAHGFRDHTYPMAQRAATLWYHDHRHGATGPAVWRGLAGFHLVHDDEEDALGLPSGDRDVPLMITDRSFAADGSFHYPASIHDSHMNGLLGDVILVNGAPWPVLETVPARYRLRLLNASNARRYRLALDPPPRGGRGLVQIGADGGLLARPARHDTIDIAPAERFDVVVDFARYRPGTRVRLVNRLGAGATAEVMRFDVTSGTGRDESVVPERLSTIDTLNPGQAVATRTFHFQLRPDRGWTINGLPYRAGRALARPRLGTTEIWRLISDFHHPVHVHLDPFQVLGRNNGAPGPYDQGWKDTVDLRPSEAVEIAVRFTGHAGTFMLHCHNLEHEDMAMMADFTTE
ncbi:multicopper oxidase family protein [Micromonospora sp. NPDC048930]|uniref:multicopper oxidase family protein n=1 Tax=Micromonospora sp. NPDC048930 TaxID=3364261 RepID=UPI0037153A00